VSGARDWGKPVGWFCTGCNFGDKFGEEGGSTICKCLSTGGCFPAVGGRVIPRWAEIPPGERPEAAPLGPPTTIASFDQLDGCDRWLHSVGKDRDAVRQNGRWFFYQLIDADDEWTQMGASGSEADAVLWVACAVSKP
jgi:hypothetical protein